MIGGASSYLHYPNVACIPTVFRFLQHECWQIAFSSSVLLFVSRFFAIGILKCFDFENPNIGEILGLGTDNVLQGVISQMVTDVDCSWDPI